MICTKGHVECEFGEESMQQHAVSHMSHVDLGILSEAGKIEKEKQTGILPLHHLSKRIFVLFSVLDWF